MKTKSPDIIVNVHKIKAPSAILRNSGVSGSSGGGVIAKTNDGADKGGEVKEISSGSGKAKEVGVKNKSIVPSASSIVLELLERTQKQRTSESQIMDSLPPADHSNAAAEANNIGHNNNMSINNSIVAAPTQVADGGASNAGHQTHQSQAPMPSNTQPSHQSVVPQLMDIYDDLTQSSTPQTVPRIAGGPMPALPLPQVQLPPPMPIPGVHYSVSNSFDNSSHNSERNTRRRSNSRSQYAGGSVLSAAPPTTSSAAIARSRKPTNKRDKTNEIEEWLPMQNARKSKKGKVSSADQRWSKRFTWPDELHRDFVSAVFDVGLKHSSPSSLMEFMRPNSVVTSEHVKSHLQKYRKNRDKSRKEFMASYDSTLDRFRKRQLDGNPDETEGSLSCGEGAALCTHASLTATSSVEGSQRSSPVPSSQVSSEATDGAGTLRMPLLTDQEKDGPIGQAFGHLAGMFQALSQQLEGSRQQGGGHVPSAPVSSQGQIFAQHQHELQQVQHRPQQQVYQKSALQPQTVEQAAATAASLHANDPSIHEVAASIPHAFLVGSRAAVQPDVHPQHHAPSPTHPHYPQAQAPAPGHPQHPSCHYSGATTAPAPQHEHMPHDHAQPPQQPQHLYGAPNPQPVHARPSLAHPHYPQAQAPAPSHHQHSSGHYSGATTAPAPPGERMQHGQAQPPQQPQHAHGAPTHQPVHARPSLAHPHYSQTQAPAPSHPQHSSSDYSGATTAPAPQGEHMRHGQAEPSRQQLHHAYGAPAPQPVYAQQQTVLSAPAHHGHQQPHQSPRGIPANPHSHPSHGILAHGQQPPRVQPAFAPLSSQPPPMANHALGPSRAAPAPAMNHPSDPPPMPGASAPQLYVNEVSQEQYPSQHQATSHQAPPPPPAPAHPQETAPAAAPSDGSSEAVHNPMHVGTGRTLQAQKESSMMKQEMQGQMAFQNKIRALKLIELSKYGGKEQPQQQHCGSSFHDTSATQHHHAEDANAKAGAAAGGTSNNSASHEDQSSEHTDTNALTLPMTEFMDQELIWNPEDDDQIFDFLMDH